ncbi:MAG: sensor histidine kinase [Pirellulaceae bacterium]
MKWPLKFQVMIPLAIVMLGVVVTLSALHVYLATEQAARQISSRIHDVTQTLARSNYPLTNGVLQQMQGLSGAEFVLVDRQSHVVAATRSDLNVAQLDSLDTDAGPAPLQLAAAVRMADKRFFHAAVNITPRDPARGPLRLHVLYPEQAYLKQRRQAIVPPLIIGGIALAIVTGLAMAIASRVTRPLGQLREQVRRIATGDFRPMTLPTRDDEVRGLALTVNQMADKLARYEERIRHTEQVRTLAQLGGSLAHQLRNSVTGARIALDIHRAECPGGDRNECLEVATRQMILMEKYLQRFLTLGTPTQTAYTQLDFAQLAAHLVPLVQPAARHAGVQLDVQIETEPLVIRGDADALEHMVLNLLLNAVEAAGQVPPPTLARSPRVRFEVSGRDPAHATLTVTDTGAGPGPDVAARLFEPFVTGKKDGAGLGLAVAKDVVEKHEGSIHWNRHDNQTTFVVELPLATEGDARGDMVGH